MLSSFHFAIIRRWPRCARAFYIVAAFLLSLTAGQAQTFNPADWGNVTLHLKADTLALANNAPVTTWGPLTWPSGIAGTTAPLFTATDARLNNRPAVRFVGTSQSLLTWSGANLGARTIFAVVIQENATSSLAGVISNGSDGLSIRRHNATLFYRSPGQGMDGNDFVGNAPTGTLAVNNVASGSYVAGSAHLIHAVAGGLKTYGNFWLGNANSTLARWLTGSIAEIIVYDGVLTPTGVDRVGHYLQSKYNLPTNFPTPDATVLTFSGTTSAGMTAEGGVLSTPGAPVTLNWNVLNTSTVSIDQGVLASSTSPTGSIVVSPAATTTYTLTATAPGSVATRTLTVHIGAVTLPFSLTEFLADNGSSLVDEDGSRQDWIEVYNPNPFAVSASGWKLTEGSNLWTFPAGAQINGGQYLVVFASGKNRTNPAGNLHTNFSLSTEGEYLALLKPDNAVATEFTPSYPAQRTDVSAGLSGGVVVYYAPPTPGAANGPGYAGFVEDTVFSIPRGFYTATQSVTITSATVGATIRYTTNGSTPTETNGTIYSVPLNISTTTTLRARAFKAGLLPTNTDTQTYLFANSVLNQVYVSPPFGWPASGVNGQVMRYGFNATLKAQYTNAQLLGALAQVPSVSIVTDQANLTDATAGIYVNALNKGDEWERPASVEWLPADNSDGFHINCGLRIRGGYSRNDQYPKHSFRLFFRNEYGESKLEFPLHGVGAADEFQSLDLRTEQNYSWANDGGTQNTAVREVFCRDLMAAMGQPTTRTRAFHLYLNGQYWGLYQTEERAQEDHGASYFGGDADDYDVLQTSNHPDFLYEVASGTVSAWQTTWNMARAHAAAPTLANYFAIQGRNASGARDPNLPVYVEVDSLMQYMLLHYYTGDGDGPLSNFLGMNRANNWRCFRNRLTDQGWRYFVHDSEHTLLASSWVDNRANNNTTSGSNRSNFTYSNPEWIHEDLALNPEYRVRFGDLVQRHLFNGGAMTPAAAQALFDARAAEIQAAIIADAARWGTNASNHTLAQWQSRLANIRQTFFANPTTGQERHTKLLGQLRTRGFFPTLNAPTFSQRGGKVANGFSLTLNAGAQSGTIYYTLDGSDPRVVGGGIATVAQPYTGPINITQNNTLVRTRFRDGVGNWSALDEAAFTFFSAATDGKLVVSKIHYHPLGSAETEYVELLNISNETLDLRALEVSGAVMFSFANGTVTTLAPGARVLIVRNEMEFAAQFGAGLPVAGQYAGNLSNGSETLLITGAEDPDVYEVTYFDIAPWPTTPDGAGPALVLINPAANLDPNSGTNWRASYVPGGVPGAVDQWTIDLWRAFHFSAAELANPAKEATLWGLQADPDRDGFANLEEFVLGGSPVLSQSHPEQSATRYTDPNSSQTYLRISSTVRPGLSGVTYGALASSDLVDWNNSPVLLGTVPQADGTLLSTWQDTEPFSTAPGGRRFLRLQVADH